MADPLSIASGVAGLVALVDLVFTKAFRYVREAKSSDKSINELVRLLQSMCGTLHILRQRMHVLDEQQLHPHLRIIPPILEDCSQLLADVDRKLSKYNKPVSSTVAGKVSATLKKLQWPFDVSSTASLVDQLTKFNDVLNTALNANTMLAVYETLHAAGDLREDIKKLERSLSNKFNQFLVLELSKDQREAVDFFRVSDSTERHRTAIRLWQHGTGKWFTDSDEFTLWLDGDTPRLWLSGIPGAGKTILASSIIEKARKECSHGTGFKALAYFYCDHRDSQTHDIHKIMGSLASQIATYHESAMKILVDHYQRYHRPGCQHDYQEQSNLIEVMWNMTQFFDRLLIVVDGLDECGKHVHDVTSELSRLASENTNNISILLLSRDEYEIQCILADTYEHIPIAARSTDLKMYVYAQMERRTADGRLVIDDDEVRSKIIEALVNGAGGMFRWVACQMDFLCDLATDNEREAALKDLPPDLYSSYERILDRVNQKGNSVRRVVQRTLRWVISSIPALTVSALREAISIEPHQLTSQKNKIPAESFILRHCSSLLRQSPDGQHLEVAHFTVKEYLERISSDDERYGFYRFSEGDVDVYKASVCVTYLNFKDFGYYENILDVKKRLQDHPLRQHAVWYWSSYAQDCLDNEDLMRCVQMLLSPEVTTCFLTWLRDFISIGLWDEGEAVSSSDLSRLCEGITPLHCASLLRLPSVAAWLLDGGLDVNSTALIGSPLHCTILGRSAFLLAYVTNEFADIFLDDDKHIHATLQTLLDHHADVKQGYKTEHMSRSPLYLLLQTRPTDVQILCSCIRLMLEAGANLDADAGKLAGFNETYVTKTARSMVQCFRIDDVAETYRAAFLHFVDLCKRSALAISPHKLDINEVLSQRQTLDRAHFALRLAAQLQPLPKLQEILALENIDVNTRDAKTGMTALHHAAEYGTPQAIELLLDHGADVNVTDKAGDTPLHKCAYRMTTVTAFTLLSRSARTDIRNRNFHHAWSVAAVNNNVPLLKLLEAQHEGEVDEVLQIVSSGDGPLFAAARYGSCDEAILFLASCPQRLNAVDGHGRNIGFFAGGMRTKTVRALVERGLDVQRIDNDGESILHSFIDRYNLDSRSKDIIRIFIASGCSVDHVSASGATALHQLLSDEKFWMLTHFSTKMEWIDLFLTTSAKNTSNDRGMSVLDFCATNKWFCPHSVEVFDHMLCCRVQSGLDQDPFSDIVEQLLKGVSPASLPKDTLHHKASAMLRKLLAAHPEPAILAQSPAGTKAAVWASQNGQGDLLSDLIMNDTDMSCSVSELDSMCVLQALMRYHHHDILLEVALAKVDDAALRVKYQQSSSLLHLLCQRESKATPRLIPMLLDKGLNIEAVDDNRITPLLLAAMNGQLEHVRLLISRGASIKHYVAEGWGILHCTSNPMCSEVVEYLIAEFGLDLPWSARTDNYILTDRDESWFLEDCTLLHKYVGHDPKTISLLLDSPFYMPVDAKTKTLETPLMIAATMGKCATVSLLLVRSAQINSQNIVGWTALSCAAHHGHFDVVNVLCSHGADIDLSDNYGFTALHFAAQAGFKNIVHFLLKNNAKSTRNAEGLTPDMVARANGHDTVAAAIQKCFQSETDSPKNNRRGITDLKTTFKAYSGLLKAIKLGDEELVHSFTILNMASQAPSCSGCSPVHAALANRQWTIANTLVQQGHSIHSLSCVAFGLHSVTAICHALYTVAPAETLELLLSRMEANDACIHPTLYPLHPLHTAVDCDDIVNLEILLRHFSKGKWNSADNFEQLAVSRHGSHTRLFKHSNIQTASATPLHVAAAMDSCRSLKLLLKYGFKLDSLTSGALTPLHFAAMYGSLQAANLLLDHGADIEARCVWGGTPLFYAASSAQRAAVDLLLRRGASMDVDATQFHWHEPLMECLSVKYAILNETMKSEWFAEMQLARDGVWTQGFAKFAFNALHKVSAVADMPINSLSQRVHRYGDFRLKELVTWLRKHDLLNIQLYQSRTTLLCTAVQRNSRKALNILLDAGADAVGGMDCATNSPLVFACLIGRLEMLKILVRRGFRFPSRNLRDTDGASCPDLMRHAHIKRWLLVDRWIEQSLIEDVKLQESDSPQAIRPWSGPQPVSEPLQLYYRQRAGETLLQWHIRKRHMLRWFEGRVLHYGPGVKYVFANFD